MSKLDTLQVGREIKTATYISMVVNVMLSLFKALVGWFSGSLSMVADAVHSLSDLVTDLAVLLGNRLGARAPDQKHPYGHGRIETFSAALVALVLIGVGGGMIYVAVIDIARDKTTAPSWAVLLVALASIGAKEILYRYTLHVARRTRSSAMVANAWHHRSDALSSVAVVLGFLTLEFGFAHGDQVAAMVVGVMIVSVGVKILADCWDEFNESAVDRSTLALIEETLNTNPAVHQWHKLRTRSVGREIFIDLHILVDPDLNIQAAHDIAEHVENTLQENLSCPANIIIHVEPDLPHLRFD